MILTELFDKTPEAKWSIQSDDDAWMATTEIDGDELSITAEKDPESKTWDIDFRINGNIELTGKGNQFGVLPLVVDGINRFIKARRPKRLTFISVEDNRSKLYKAMIKRLMPKWNMEAEKFSDYTLFKITR